MVPPREEASLEYSFTPNKAIVPREFFVALTAFYTNLAGEVRHKIALEGGMDILLGILPYSYFYDIIGTYTPADCSSVHMQRKTDVVSVLQCPSADRTIWTLGHSPNGGPINKNSTLLALAADPL